LIDRQNHHCFQPLLYQVATAALSPADVAWPIRHILRKQQKNATVLMAEVRGVYFLITVRDRFIVAFTWLRDYVTFQRGARLIEVPPERK
jgi:hypothetical protein